MSARRLAAALCAGLLSLAGAAPARAAAADSVLVRVGGQLSARAGDNISVPITVDLSGAPGRALGGYRAVLRFNPALLYFQGAQDGGFATPQVNSTYSTDSGKVVLAALQPSGASGTVVLFNAKFWVQSDTGQSPVTITFEEMTATATSVTPFEDLTGLLRIVNGTFCKSRGLWGDANSDGYANSLDALVALSSVVGIPIDTTLMKPALTDVDGDGRVTSRDALIILSYAVGLPVSGYRVLLTAPGACGTGSPITIVVTPDSVELQAGQAAYVQLDARDSTGRSVTVDSGTVVSSDPSVAAFLNGNSGANVQARAPGVATFTVRLGPGVAATFKVTVIARRTTWYADVQRARNAPTQTGTQALPFEFIGDALLVAHDGDTVRVASGTYEEVVSQRVSVALLGDSVNRPIIEPRGAPTWYSWYDAVDLGSYTGKVEFSNFVVRAGMVYLDAHDFVVRNVQLDGNSTELNAFAMLELYGENLTPATAPAAAGPMRSAGPVNLGNVLVDGVVVHADSTYSGIVVVRADSVEIRNSSVTRTLAGTSPTCGPTSASETGILVTQASVSYIHDNVVTNPYCQGIGAFDLQNDVLAGDLGQVTVSRNRVTGAPSRGIVAGGRTVKLDHNAVRSTGVPGIRTYGATAGVEIVQTYGSNGDIAPQSVVSLGDSVLSSGGRGFVVDTTVAGSIDSLVVDGVAHDSSGTASGVELAGGGTYTLTHSHVSNALFAEGVYYTGENTVLHSRGNRIVNVDNGITAYQGCYCAPPARPSGPAQAAGGPGPMRSGAPYTGGPDSLVSIADTVLGAGSNAFYPRFGLYARVDSAVVDSAYYGVYGYYLNRLDVTRSALRHTSYGVSPWFVDSVSVLADTVLGNTNGMYVYSVLDSVTIRHSLFDSSSAEGIVLQYATVRMDSSAVTHSGYGIRPYYSSGVRVRWSRFQANGVGIDLGINAILRSRVDSSNFLGNGVGAKNEAAPYGDSLFAINNYWNDANGPRCDSLVTGYKCTGTVGDTIVSAAITAIPFLGSAAPSPAAPSRPVLAAIPRLLASVRLTPQPARLPIPLAPATETAATLRAAAARAASAPMAAPSGPRERRQYAPAWHRPRAARQTSPAAATAGSATRH